MMYEQFNKYAASVKDRIAWALCQIIDDDAPLRWTRYRFAAGCIAKNPEVMADLCELRGDAASKGGVVNDATVIAACNAYDNVLAGTEDPADYRAMHAALTAALGKQENDND